MTGQAAAFALVDDVTDLFTFPDIFFQISEMINDPRFSIEEIGRVVSKDPALSARLLRLVNSSFYGFQAKIDTISRAIVVVGLDDLKNLVLATSVVDSFNRIPSEIVDMTEFWLHSVHCGVMAKLLAKESLVLHCERLFLAGLMHNIGSLVLYDKLPDKSYNVLLAAGNDRNLVAGLEQEMIGFNHAEVGGALIKRWGLAESLYESVSCYLNPEVAQVYKLDACILALSVYLVNASTRGMPVESVIDSVGLARFPFLRVGKSQIMNAAEQAESEFYQVFDLIAVK